MDTRMILLASGCWALSSLLSLSRWHRLHIPLALAGSLAALIFSVHVLLGAHSPGVTLPFLGFHVWLEADGLSAAFMIPLHLIASLGAVYNHLPMDKSGRQNRFFFGTLVAGLSLMFISRQSVLFLLNWEIMALSAFFLVNHDHEKAEVRKCGWIYLICTHTGTLLLTAAFILLAERMGHWFWTQNLQNHALDPSILILSSLGFLFKAGAFPLHFWLPEAHAHAPSHVSAILSAVMIKAGIYGILRMGSLMPTPGWMGAALLIVGCASALYGVVCALAQKDYKRILAYSSIENIGIILMGVGMAFVGRHNKMPLLTALGLGGAILHIWNHAVFKGLLFFGAGTVLHATHTRNIEALGGLAKLMPKTAMVLLPGVLAVSALPPFNGFISEWMLYRAFFASLMQSGTWTAFLAIFALSMTGGLAVIAFARFFAFIFLGNPRQPFAHPIHDAPPRLFYPMALLASLCLGMSLGASALTPALDRIIQNFAPGSAGHLHSAVRSDLNLMSLLSLLLILISMLAYLWIQKIKAAKDQPPTWDCGYTKGNPRMQYSAFSFSREWAEILPGMKQRFRRIRPLFPTKSTQDVQFMDWVGERWLPQGTEEAIRHFMAQRRFQKGHLSVYILYIIVALIGSLIWMMQA